MTQFPNPDTQFQKGQSGNPGGMSKETRAKLDAARDKAAEVYLAFTEALHQTISEQQAEEIIGAIRADNLKLLKDVMDRTEGTPKSSVDLSSEDGSMSPAGLDHFYAAQRGQSKPEGD